jgi:hypothetical protein
MNFVKEKWRDKEIKVSMEEYNDFKIGDKYYNSATIDGFSVMKTQKQCDLANRKIEAKYYLESAGGKFLVL